MSYLAVCGVETSIAVGSLRETVREIGSADVAFDGTATKSRLAVKRDFAFRSTPLTQAEAYAWDCLLRGLGHVWSFDSTLYSSKGLTAGTVTGCSIDTTEEQYDGTGCLQITSGNTFAPASVYNTSIGCTVLVWRKATATSGSGGHTHFICTEDSAGDNAYWTNGASKATGSLPDGIAIASGAVTLSGYSAATRYFDDLVVLPFVIPDAWASQLYTLCNAQAFSSLPRLYVNGDAVPDSSRTMLGECESEVVPAVLSGSFSNAARQISVALRQV